jgi:hypothetical protein
MARRTRSEERFDREDFGVIGSGGADIGIPQHGSGDGMIERRRMNITGVGRVAH